MYPGIVRAMSGNFTVSGEWSVVTLLMVQRQKMHGSQRCYGKLVELTVDDFWLIADAGDQNFGGWHTVVGEVPWSSVPKTMMDCHSKLVLHSVRNNQPVQVVVHQP